jgi:RHH-type rel operon transcriptional repressor/antitoxin RelB
MCYTCNICNTSKTPLEIKMITVRLPKKLENRLKTLASKTGRTKTYYIIKAIERFLEDREDYLLAVAVLEEKNPSISLEEVIKKLDLES